MFGLGINMHNNLMHTQQLYGLVIQITSKFLLPSWIKSEIQSFRQTVKS